MEDLSDLGGRGHLGAASRRPAPPSLPSPSSSKVSVQVYTVPSSSAAGGEAAARAQGGVAPMIHAVSSSVSGHGGRVAVGDLDPLKAKIVSHPRYHRLLAAFLDCHKVGCPPEAAEEIAAAAREREAWQRAAAGDAHTRPDPDPELDQFMESYCELLVVWKEELTRPLREAKEFLAMVELQLNSITNTGTPMGALISAAEDKTGIDMSDDDDQEEGSGCMEAEAALALGIDPSSDDKELKRQLLRKYSGCLGSLRKELCKKRKKGKLPKEARQKLLSWWELHYRWPYPSEMEKIALAESTGLEQKQINNWFINQRKRHWKPSEEMQFAVMDGFHHPAPPNAAALYVDARLVGATPAMFFARPEHGAHGLWHN